MPQILLKEPLDMRKFFENKVVYAVIVFIFAACSAWSAKEESADTQSGYLLRAPAELIAHGPTLPPDPWQGGTLLAHGPTLPPDPWQGGTLLAHGPTLPPDPWQGGTRLTHGPTLPPDPWQGGMLQLAHGLTSNVTV
jgi:hypothetical protein